MAQQVQAHDYTPDNLSMIPRTKNGSRELSVVICILTSTHIPKHVYSLKHTPKCTHTFN